MQLQISNFLAATVLLLLLGIVASVVVALSGIKSSIRSSRRWRISLGVLVAVTVLQVFLIASHRDFEQAYENFQVWRYTFHPKVPTTFDGMLFPAGSTVIEYSGNPSHPVSGGTVPKDTTLLGLRISGDFSIENQDIESTDAGTNTRYVSESTLVEPVEISLVEPADIHSVPCAAGKFKHTIPTVGGKEEIDCTITKDYTVNGITIPSNSDVEITNDHGSIEPSATVKHPWKFSTIECASGLFTTYIGFECPLAHDQILDGYPMAAGQETSFRFDEAGTAFVKGGVLSRNFEVLGVIVPTGSVLHPLGTDCETATAEDLRSHKIPENECVTFLLPEKTPITVAGKKFEANDINLYFSNKSIDVITASNGHNENEHAATFDLTTQKWCEDETCR